jgi:hypothetical protein
VAVLRSKIASVLTRGGPLVMQLGGLALVAVGFFMIAPWLGCLVAGGLLFALGWALDGRP